MSSAIKIICQNRKASHNYALEDRYEAGMVLTGSEVKSLRSGNVNLSDSYALVKSDSVYLINCHISPYHQAGYAQHEPTRTRKLLLHKHEIHKLWGKTETKGYTVIPTKLYFSKGKAKVELALAKSKKKYDKRETLKKKQQDREARQAMKRHHS